MKEKFSKCTMSFSGKAVGFKCDEVVLPNGKKAVREYLVHPGAVAIVPLLDSPQKMPLDKCRVVLVRQYRYPAGQITEELPAGKIDPGESALKCLPRELKEETGYSAKCFRPLISFWPTPAFSDEIIHIYWAEGLKKGRSSPDEDEFLDVRIETFGSVLKKIQQGRIRDSKTVIGILAFAQFVKNPSWPTPA
jgi:ADP-ribose pyrophosphatase